MAQTKNGYAAFFYSIVLGGFAAMIMLASTPNVIQAIYASDDDIVLIYREIVNRPVTYRGAAIGNTWVSPLENVENPGDWLFDKVQETYTSMDDSPLEIRLPKGRDRTLTFNAGPDQGIARVVFNGKTTLMNCYNDEEVALGLPHKLADSCTVRDELQYFAALAAFIFISVVAFIFKEPSCPIPSVVNDPVQQRELWGDLSRIICCCVIVVLHNTCNTFNDYAHGRLSTLIVNCFTAFAVPCFFMLSGVYLLRKPHSICEMVFCRVPRTFLPVLFWGIVYIFIEGDIRIGRFLMLPFQQSTPHLWFMYSLFGIYMLLPLLSKLYCNLPFREKLYLLGLLTFAPMVIHDGAKLLGGWGPIPKFALLWPELGLFFCGGVLWDLRENIKRKKPIFYGLLFLVGLVATIVGTVITSAYVGVPDKSFISTIGTAGNVLMAGSMLCLALTLDNVLTKKLPVIIRSAICKLGKLTMGIYFIHMLFLFILNNRVIPWLPLFNNTGSMFAMILSAFVYVCLSAIVCASAKRVRWISRLF